MYYLLKTPPVYKKLQEEIDTVVGRNGRLHIEHLAKLPYLNACIRESLRLHPTAPGFTLGVHPEKPHEGDITLGNGKYKIEKTDSIAVLLNKAMQDPVVYGPDSEEFKPERMLDENFEKLPRNSWKVSRNQHILGSFNPNERTAALRKWNAWMHRTTVRLAGNAACYVHLDAKLQLLDGRPWIRHPH